MSHVVEILSVGTELLLGNIANTDAQMLSQGLSAIGINVYYHTVVGDNPARVMQAVQVAKKRADIIITTGGLGPTCDDLTKNALAESFGKKLVYHEPSAIRLKEYFTRLGRQMTENNMQQAYLPEGCQVLENDWGTAPGCAFYAEGCHVIMLPGPPSECKPMFLYRAKPYLQALSEGVIFSHTLRLFGIGESQMESQIRDQMNQMSNPTLAPYAKEGECELRVTAKAEDEAAAEVLLSPVVAQMREIFGNKIYGVDVDSLEQVVLSLLLEQGKTFATAESCTGGLVAKRMTDLPGASKGFLGGIVSYTNEVKMSLLGVSAETLDAFGAVSPETAIEMAQGARRVLGCDIAISVTGVAGPDSDERGTPVGRAYIALVAQGVSHVRTLNLGSRRMRVRNLCAKNALDMVRRYLQDLPLEEE